MNTPDNFSHPTASHARPPGVSRTVYDREVLTPDALGFVADLHRKFDARRRELLARARRAPGSASTPARALDFLPETRPIREATGRIAPIPADLQDRRVEITGPVDRKMIINALNSGAKRLHGRLRGRHLARPGTT